MNIQKGFFGNKQLIANLLLLLLFSLCVPFVMAAAEKGVEIGEVKTAGNITIKTSKIISQASLRAGMNFDPVLADEDVERIAKIDGVEYAYYNAEIQEGKVVLTYVLYEKNLVRDVQFIGNDVLKSAVLLKKTKIKRGDYLDKFTAKQGQEKLIEYYQKKGFSTAICELDQDKLEYGIVAYKIIEGKRVRITSTTFVGNEVLSTKALKKGLKSKSKKFYMFKNYFSKKKLAEDIENIEKTYHEDGYINVKVTADEKYSDDKTEVDIVFNIREGEVFVVSEMEVYGNEAIDTDILLLDAKLQIGQAYSDEKADFDIKKIKTAFNEIGYIDAKVVRNREFVAPGKIKVAYNIEQGEQFRIGKINITGNEQTHDKVVRRVLDEYDFIPGQWYNSDIAQGSGQGNLEKSIQRATYASSALITPQGSGGKVKDALVTIAEGQTGMIMFGAGVGSNDGVVGQIVYEERNFDISDKPENWRDLFSGKAFKGAGQKLRIALEPGTEYSRYSVSFTEPYLKDKPVQLDTSASSYVRGREDYDEERLRGYVSLRKRFKNGWHRGFAFRIEDVGVEGIDTDAPLEIFKYEGSNVLAGFKIFTGKSTVDNRYNPSKGYIFDTDFEVVTGEESFSVISATNRWYKTLYEDLAERKTVLETKVRGAAIVGNAPPFEKFYAGGTGSIRGFDYRGVSTRGASADPVVTDRDPIGSDWILTANTEVAIPLGQGSTIAALFFADAGLIDSGGVRTSIGTGIQIMIPQWFGPVPMRFELAVPLMKEEEDETQTFSFTIGRLF